MYAVVIEWSDGTIVVNGPYAEEIESWQAARKLAEQIEAEDGMPIQNEPEYEGEFFRLGEDGTDQIDVYAVKMGEPVNIEAKQ